MTYIHLVVMQYSTDFVGTYFFTNEPLSSQIRFSSKLDWVDLMRIYLMKKCSTAQRFFREEVTSYKIHTLDGLMENTTYIHCTGYIRLIFRNNTKMYKYDR